MKLMSVQVSWKLGWYGWSWNVAMSSPTRSQSTAISTARCGLAAEGVRNEPKVSGCP
jgi:hypothetical protein